MGVLLGIFWNSGSDMVFPAGRGNYLEGGLLSWDRTWDLWNVYVFFLNIILLDWLRRGRRGPINGFIHRKILLSIPIYWLPYFTFIGSIQKIFSFKLCMLLMEIFKQRGCIKRYKPFFLCCVYCALLYCIYALHKTLKGYNSDF